MSFGDNSSGPIGMIGSSMKELYGVQDDKKAPPSMIGSAPASAPKPLAPSPMVDTPGRHKTLLGA